VRIDGELMEIWPNEVCDKISYLMTSLYSEIRNYLTTGERVQKGIAYWDKQNNDMPAPNCMLKVRGEIIKVEGL